MLVLRNQLTVSEAVTLSLGGLKRVPVRKGGVGAYCSEVGRGRIVVRGNNYGTTEIQNF